MIELVTVQQPLGELLWGRLSGCWGAPEWRRLYMLLARMQLTCGSRVVLDLSAIDHLHFRAVPLLFELARGVEGRGACLHVTGMSQYVQRILELGGALEGRDFIEQHGLGSSPLPDPADPSARGGRWLPWSARDPRGLAVPSLN